MDDDALDAIMLRHQRTMARQSWSYVKISLHTLPNGCVACSTEVIAARLVKYVIIGAGQTGLLFAHRCMHARAGSCAVVERRMSIGGHWNDVKSSAEPEQRRSAAIESYPSTTE